MVKFLHDTDPYRHHIVIHTFPPQQDEVYQPLLGDKSLLTGVSLQNSWKAAHQRTLQWVRESAAAGRPWVVANDEQNPASLGVPPDPGYEATTASRWRSKPKGSVAEGYVASKPYTMHDIRKLTLWGTLMAGGAGVEYYFGYQLPENDLVCAGLPQPRQELGLLPHRAGLLPRRKDSVCGNDERQCAHRQREGRQQQILPRQTRRALPRLSAQRRHHRPRPHRRQRQLHREMVQSAHRRRSSRTDP